MAENVSARAIARGVRMTPRKLSLVASLVRGRSVADALTILQHTPKHAATPVAKAIASAQANAVNTHGAERDGLVIQSLQVTAGPRIKRFRPGAMGRAKPYIKRTSHILVIVSGDKKVKKAAAAKPAATKESK